MKTYILIPLALFFSLFIQAKIGFGTVTPNSSSAIEVQSTTKGLLIPRMTMVQLEAIIAPAKGLIVYCLDCQEEGLYVNIEDAVLATWTDTQGDLLHSLVNALAEVLEDSVAGSSNANGISVSLNQIEDTGVTGIVATNLISYQAAIAAETGFSNPVTIGQVQTIIDVVNVIGNALNEVLEDSAAGSNNANGIPVSFAQINSTGVTGAVLELLVYYQNDIAIETGFSSPPTTAEVQAIIKAGQDITTAIVDVISSTGRTWMDRNLGVSQQATSMSDTAAYGDLYQWGRRKDGHELRTNTNSIVGPVTAANENFNAVTSEYNWLTPEDNTRWNGTTKGAHDPCPAGYRVPTIAELNAERGHFSTDNLVVAFASVLKLTAAGLRQKVVNSVDNEGVIGWYNSSDYNLTSMRINPANITLDNNGKAFSFSIGCIKEQ